MDTSDTKNTEVNEVPRKAYSAPKLYVYGDIREFTKTLGGTVGKNDGGGGNDKTGF